MSTGWELAIDFGTSNTAAAARETDGTINAIALSHHSNLMPSAVFIQAPDEILVGQVALNQAATNPAAFLAAPKRSIPHGIVNINSYDVPVQQPVAAVLRSVLDRAVTAHRGQSPARVVLTHPEGWSPHEVQVLIAAATIAGVPADRVSTISEPRAAAAHYSRSEPLAVGEKIAVFDFGGGTLDIAVLQADSTGGFDVIAAGGDNQLGGKNLDAVLRHWVDAQLLDTDPDRREFLRRTAPMGTLRTLEDSIRHAKELLSEAAQATITVPGATTGDQLGLTLGRSEFDELITTQIDRSLALTRDTLTRAGITGPTDLRALFLTGGSSRIPLVHSRLQTLGPIATLDDPKTVVARGALTRAITAAAAPATSGVTARPARQAAPAHLAPPPETLNFRAKLGMATGKAAANVVNFADAKRRTTAIAAAAVAAAVVVGGVMLARSGSDGEASAAALPTTTTEAATPVQPVTGNAAVGTTAATLEAAYPAALSEGIKKPCTAAGFDTDGAYMQVCVIDTKSDLAKAIGVASVPAPPSFTATINHNSAASTLATWQKAQNANIPGQLTMSPDGTKGVFVLAPAGSTAATASFADIATGLNMSFTTMTGGDTDQAMTFYRESGLMP
ncbi:Hsp70 family protein [Aldersonia sp. NBC_00410]|uniref:Hsp70 family protein n=1 Tax=Aldersonia sp. NBC_00410 TaxID=2975954 RepID=UPI002252C9AD|nr:Hsp70 family protein [Aldersonia sp. NBC_00410]MCX5044847.1 Hsp70 family protein [Aldersonia sp. NBC_00410]MCX5046334.1 Hsp70 family protein [Aldersonia sp. NBC_00410]